MDTNNYLVYAVPVFLGSMALEVGISASRQRFNSASREPTTQAPGSTRFPWYRWSDSFANLGCGLGSQLTGLYISVATTAIYSFVYAQFRLFEISPESWATWAFAIIGVDLAYYVWHRLSHTVNVFWATHIVHHQSEQYNLSVALRQSWFSSSFNWIFYLPLALLGVPPAHYLAAGGINLLYQFFIHTRAIRTMGPLDGILNTPSHHRVHHGSNFEYLDRNYAGMFIVWDRLFGTFAPETVPVEYGLVKPFHNWNPVWANFHYWRDLWRDAGTFPRFADKWKLWWKNPGWRPGDRSLDDAKNRARGRAFSKYSTESSHVAIAYVFVQFLAATIGTSAVMGYGRTLPGEVLGFIYAALFASMGLWSGLLAGEVWARSAEALRLVAIAGLAAYFATSFAVNIPALVAGGAYLVVSGGLLLSLRATTKMATASPVIGFWSP